MIYNEILLEIQKISVFDQFLTRPLCFSSSEGIQEPLISDFAKRNPRNERFRILGFQKIKNY